MTTPTHTDQPRHGPAHSLAEDGYLIVDELLSLPACAALLAKTAPQGERGAGTRKLLAEPWCAALACEIRSHPVVAGLIPADFLAVQCTYFEKSSQHNWLVPIHQDLGIPVAGRIADPSLRGWTEKEGSLFVQAPESVLQALVAVRLHLDPCTASDGPVRVVPGSHRQGALSPGAAIALRAAGTEVSCCCQPGQALVFHPLLLHASSKASGTSRRRVLHLLFGPPRLPLGLHWQRTA